MGTSKIDKRTFHSEAEARAAGPVHPKVRLFQVDADDSSYWLWARHKNEAVTVLATTGECVPMRGRSSGFRES